MCFSDNAIVLSYTRIIKSAAKLALGIVNLFIGIVYFLIYGTEPIQRFFALPLYLAIGILYCNLREIVVKYACIDIRFAI